MKRKNVEFLDKHLVHGRPVGISRGMTKANVVKRFKPEPYSRKNILYFDDGNSEVHLDDDGKVYIVLLSLVRSIEKTISVFGSTYGRKARYSVGDITEFLVDANIDFQFAYQIGDGDHPTIKTVLGDSYCFHNETDGSHLVEIITLFV